MRKLLAAAAMWGPVRAQAPSTLTVGVVSDPVTLDPAFFASYFELYSQYLVYEPLLAMSPQLTVGPGLASYEQPGAVTYTFTLKPGVTFQDGTAYDAAAATWNIDRMTGPGDARLDP